MSGGKLVVNIVEDHLSWKTSRFVNKKIFLIQLLHGQYLKLLLFTQSGKVVTTFNLYLVKISFSSRYLLLFDTKLLLRKILLNMSLNVGFKNFDPLLMKISVQQPIFIGHNFNKTGEFWKYFSYKNLFSIFFSNIITSVKSFRFNVPTIVVWVIFHEKR